jgi:hypothetical protein
MWTCLFGFLYIFCQNVQYVISVELTSHIYQIENKPNPHPERPDRLRAIAASLAAAGEH